VTELLSGRFLHRRGTPWHENWDVNLSRHQRRIASMWKRPSMTWYGNCADNECKTTLGLCKAQGREPELELEMEELLETKTGYIATKAKRRGNAPYYEKATLRAHWFAESARRSRYPSGRSSRSIATEEPHQLYTSLLLPLLQRCSYFYLPDSAYQKIGIWRIHEPTDSISRPHPSLIAKKGRRISAVETDWCLWCISYFRDVSYLCELTCFQFSTQHTSERSISW